MNPSQRTFVLLIAASIGATDRAMAGPPISLTDAARLGPLEVDLTRARSSRASLAAFMDEDASATTTAPPTDAAPGSADPASDEELAKKLQNPIANLISVPLQFNWDTGIGVNNANKYLLNIQPVIPFSISENWNVISRTILPVVYQDSPSPGISSAFGIGDITQSLFFSPKDPVGGWILGAGPVMQIPTGTDDLFRTQQFSLGPTAIALKQTHGWTYGALWNHLWSVAATSSDAAYVNATFFQPFVAYTWPTATTLGLQAESTYDWRESEWTIPLNVVVSQVVHMGGQPVQFQLGGRYYAERPAGGPTWGLRFTVTFLFPN